MADVGGARISRARRAVAKAEGGDGGAAVDDELWKQ